MVARWALALFLVILVPDMFVFIRCLNSLCKKSTTEEASPDPETRTDPETDPETRKKAKLRAS